MTEDVSKASNRGFASMTPERRRELGSKGGKAVAAENRAFSIDRSLAAAAGKAGAQSGKPDNRRFVKDPDFARAAGAKGGQATAAKRRGAGMVK